VLPHTAPNWVKEGRREECCLIGPASDREYSITQFDGLVDGSNCGHLVDLAWTPVPLAVRLPSPSPSAVDAARLMKRGDLVLALRLR
jgi:hypothetical protein